MLVTIPAKCSVDERDCQTTYIAQSILLIIIHLLEVLTHLIAIEELILYPPLDYYQNKWFIKYYLILLLFFWQHQHVDLFIIIHYYSSFCELLNENVNFITLPDKGVFHTLFTWIPISNVWKLILSIPAVQKAKLTESPLSELKSMINKVRSIITG